jgi:hypothetical protein
MRKFDDLLTLKTEKDSALKYEKILSGSPGPEGG